MTNIRKVTIFYFSGTGNAQRIASWFYEFALKKSIDCGLYDIAKCDRNNIAAFTANALILIISPTHGFNFPKITLDFIAHFPKGNNRIVLMNTRAGMKIGKLVTPGLTGIALLLSSLILIIKGYRIVGQIPFDMPSNWLSVHPALNEKTVKSLHKINYTRVEKHADKVYSGHCDFLALRDLAQDILISPIALGYYWIGRFVFAKSFYASAGCDNCGLCVKQCPVRAIKRVKERPYWTFKCESCMHCMNNCPKKAIETAHGLIIAMSVLSSAVATLLFQRCIILNIQYSVIRLIIWSVIMMILLSTFYYFQHLLLRNRKLSRFISFVSLTHYKFWGRYKSLPDAKWKE